MCKIQTYFVKNDVRLHLHRSMLCMFVWHQARSEKAMAPHSSTLVWKTHGWRSLVGCSPWGHEESDMTEWLHFHISLSCIGEEMAAHSSVVAWRIPGAVEPVYGVTQSWTWLKWLSSSRQGMKGSGHNATLGSSVGLRELFVSWTSLHYLTKCNEHTLL